MENHIGRGNITSDTSQASDTYYVQGSTNYCTARGIGTPITYLKLVKTSTPTGEKYKKLRITIRNMKAMTDKNIKFLEIQGEEINSDTFKGAVVMQCNR